MISDPLGDLSEALMRAGQPVEDLIFDGRLHRYDGDGKRGRKPCWYVVHQLSSGHVVAVYGDNRLGTDYKVKWRSWEHNGQAPLSAEERKRFEQEAERAQRAREAQTAKAQANAAHNAKEEWERCGPAGQSEYLMRKRIGAHGIRFGRDDDRGDYLAVPMRAGAKWRGIQRIYDDGTKRFTTGCEKKGAYALLGILTERGPVYICEGYATGATIHEATGSLVIVAFDAGNIQPVIQSLIKTYRARLVVCADNDLWSSPKIGNTGAKLAEEVRYRFNLRTILPDFEGWDAKDLPTDFNDLLAVAGLPEVIRQLGGEERRQALRHGQEGPSPKGELLPKPYCRIDPRTIAPRPFVYARHYAKGYVSATVAPGGGGKSSFGIVEAISMALGRCLFTGEPLRYGPMRVWYLALEDPEDEMMRKIEAVCLHYGVNESLPNLYLHSGRGRPVCVAVEMRSEGGMVSVVAQPDVQRIIRECKRTAMDAIVVDPSVSSHKVPENDPVKQEGVMSLWRGISEDAVVAVEIQHHSRKLNGQEITIDDVRGATSIVNVARSTRLIAPMSGADAIELDVDDDRRGYYFCVVNGKANFMPKAKDRKWYEFHSVCLGNETPQFEADNVGVVGRWRSRFENQTPEEKLARVRGNAQENADQLYRYLHSELQLGNRYSRNQLVAIRDSLGLGRNEVDAAIALLEGAGRVTHEKRPEDDKRRGSSTYLCPVN